MAARGRRARWPHHRGAGGIHRGHLRFRSRQPARHRVAAHRHAVERGGGRGAERRPRPVGGQSHARPHASLRHRPLHGRRVSARDENRGDVVSLRPRPRHRRPRGRAHDGLGRATLLAASGLSLLAALILWRLVTEGPDRFPPARFDLHMAGAVFRERGPRLACFGYFGHMWELYSMWAWLGLFLSASLDAHGGGSYLGLNAPAATFVTMGVGGALGAYAGGALADRWGRTALTMAAMALSGLTAATIGFTFGGPPAVTFFLALLWGITVIADSAQFSTAVTELCPPAYVGTALTAQTCVGFALTIVSIWLIPPVVHVVGWQWAFALLAPGPALGVLAMARLRGSPDAVRMAGGRR